MINWVNKKVESTHAVELLTDDYYTVGVVFNGCSKSYTFKVDNSIELEESDMVVVFALSRFTVATVLEVHKEQQIDFDADYQYSYIVQKVDTELFDKLNERSTKIRTALTELSRRKLKRELLEEFTGSLDEDGIKKLESDFDLHLE